MASSTYHLPADLTLMIFMELESPAEVYSFIRTSKSLYHIFQNHKISILSTVIQNAVHPEAMRDFLLANRANSVFNMSMRQEQISILREYSRNPMDDRRYQKARLQCVGNYIRSAHEVEVEENFRNPDVLYSLCKLWILVDSFVIDFAAHVLPHFHQLCLHNPDSEKESSASEKIVPSSLSKKERARLFRAFCRFEEYRRLYGGPDHVCRDSIGHISSSQENFTGRYESWERLEMATIHRYLIKRMTKAVDDEEDAFVTMLADNPEQEGDDTGKLSSVEYLDFHGLGLFDDHGKMKRQIAFMVDLGLPFARYFNAADFTQRLQALTGFCFEELCESAETFFEQSMWPRHERVEKQNTGNNDGPTMKHLRPAHPGSDCFSQTSKEWFINTGMIFWEQERLDAAPPAIFHLRVQSSLPYRNGDTYTCARDRQPSKPLPPLPSSPSRLSIQERLPNKFRAECVDQLENSLTFWRGKDIFKFFFSLEY